LTENEIKAALQAGAACAQQLFESGLIEGAALRLLGETLVVGTTAVETPALQAHHGNAIESTVHA
jgi:hypothetical protein